MKSKKKFILFSCLFIILFSLTSVLNRKNTDSLLNNGVSLDMLVQAYSANAETPTGCNGTACAGNYNYNPGTNGGDEGCCSKYASTPGKRGTP